MSTTLADPILRDLARHEAEQDAEAAREELVEARISVLADHLLADHADEIMNAVYSHKATYLRWRALEDQLCLLEARGLFNKSVPGSDTRLLDLADEMRRIVRDAAERLARETAAAEVDRDLERRSHNKEISQ